MSKATAMTRRTRKMSKTLGKSHRAAFRGGSIVDSKSTINPLDGTKLTLLRRVLIVALLVSSGCVFVPRAMWNRAEENRQRIGQVKIGQTLDEVRAIMRKDPEKRELRSRFDFRHPLWSQTAVDDHLHRWPRRRDPRDDVGRERLTGDRDRNGKPELRRTPRWLHFDVLAGELGSGAAFRGM